MPSMRTARAIIAPLVLVCLVACSPLSRDGSTRPTPSVITVSEFPTIAGQEFDESLRNGNTSLPKLGRLLAATQTGRPTTTAELTIKVPDSTKYAFVLGAVAS